MHPLKSRTSDTPQSSLSEVERITVSAVERITCQHCSRPSQPARRYITHRKAKLANHWLPTSSLSMTKTKSNFPKICVHTLTISTPRSICFCFSPNSSFSVINKTSFSSVMQGHSLTPLISLIITLVIMTSSLLHTGAAAAAAAERISVRVSQITNTTPSNFTAPMKKTCGIGLLVPAVYHNSSDTAPRHMWDQYTKSGTHWYPRDLADVVQDALDGAVRVFLSNQNPAKKKGGVSPWGQGQGLSCDVNVQWRDAGWCDERTALGQTVSLHGAAEVIVGPPCHNSLGVVGLLASFLGKPVIAWEPVLREVVEKETYENVFSVYGAFEDFAHAAATVIKRLKWTKIAIMYEESPLCETLIEQLGQEMLDGNLATEAAKVILHRGNSSDLRPHLTRIKSLTRTLVTCSQQSVLTSVLTKAEEVGMTDGYYAFLHLSFDVRPLTIEDADGQRSPLDVVLQLGQFHELGGRKEVEEEDRRNQTAVIREVRLSGDKLTPLESQQSLSPYLHDAIVVATLATQMGMTNFSPEHLSIGHPYPLKTGAIEFDEKGVRKATFSLVHRVKAGGTVLVANVSANHYAEWDIVWPGGHVPISDITCQGNDTCIDVPGIIAGTTMAILSLVLLLTLAGYFYRRHRRRVAAAKKEWLVDDRDVKRRRAKLPMSNGFTSGPGSNMETVKRLVRMETRGTLGLGSNCSLDKNMLYAPIGNYKDMVVAVKHVRWTHVQIGKREMLEDLTTVKELSHDNVNQFVGAHVSSEPGSSYVLFRYCSKGSLQDVLANDDIKLDWMFKLSFALDLAKGIEFIHKTALRSHGNLKSSNCVIDSRWVLKVTDYGAITSYRKPGSEDDQDNRVYFSSLLWTAPELLRMSKRPHKGTQKGDVYSIGIILQEILFRCAPYSFNYMEPEDIITLVKKEHAHRNYRPVIPPDNELPPRAINLMITCWSEAPDNRPDIHQIRKRVRDLNGSKRFNIMDNMLQMLESYSSNLEQLVNDRTEELEAEKRKTDSLLYQMLPPLVAEQLKSGMSVTPESYDQVSIFFSDIVGFTAIASQSKPLEVVDLLNDLYTCFDEVIARRDVYKVETIGDAYMCVSGCPRRNGNRHAGEIANMALDLISAVTHFRIRHKPQEQLNLRVGLHTGACAAGVVGRTMPRYCLFGDTVNMASRMESTGKALHIHMSSQMKDALDELDWGFLTVERGFIEVKGKGLQKTFWLAGKKNYKKPLPDSLVELQRRLEEGGLPPTPSFTCLTVGDSMFSALRKTSITVSNITMETSPCTSDTEDAGGGADGRREHAGGGANTGTSQYGNLLEASVHQHHGKKKTVGGKAARRARDDEGGDGQRDGSRAVSPITSGSVSEKGGRGSPGSKGSFEGNLDSSGRHGHGGYTGGAGLSRARKSLGEISGVWNTVESCDSDPGATVYSTHDKVTDSGAKVLSRPPPAVHSHDERLADGQGRKQEGKEEDAPHLKTKRGVGAAIPTIDTEVAGRKGKQNLVKTQDNSESFELTPSGMKRKRAVVSPPRLVLIQSGLSNARGEDSPTSSAGDHNPVDCHFSMGGNSHCKWLEEVGSECSESPKSKCPVKKDSACYSMADSVTDSFESSNKQFGNGNVQFISDSTNGHDNLHNNNSIKIVAKPAYRSPFPPILHVTSSSPVSPTAPVENEFKSDFSFTTNTADSPPVSNGISFAHQGTTRISPDRAAHDQNSFATSSACSSAPSMTSSDRKYIPVTFDTSGTEVREMTLAAEPTQVLVSSAPIITVQQEDGSRANVSKILDAQPIEQRFSEAVPETGLPRPNDEIVWLSREGTPTHEDSTADAEGGRPQTKTWTSPVNERDHKWFPQSNGRDFLVHNHQNSIHPALITVHNEDCPASADTSRPVVNYTHTDSNHRRAVMNDNSPSDTKKGIVGNTRSEFSAVEEPEGDASSNVSRSNGGVPVKTARRKHKTRREKSNGQPDDMPKIDIT